MKKRKEKVAVVGIGYVGLPVACIFAEQGFETIGIDILEERVEAVNRGECPIGGEEPGLDELLERMVSEGMMAADTDISSISQADLIVVCVDTPVGEDKRPVLNSLTKAVESIAFHIKERALLSIESTIPPGTMSSMVIPKLEDISGKKVGEDVFVVHCPERVMPGRLLANLREYKRVLGAPDERSLELGMHYYSTFVEDEILPATLINAEICKTGENAYRDVQIAFANEMALICESLGADVFEVRELINSCPFRDMHLPGSGVGGYCLPKDSWLLLGNVEHESAKVISGAREVNEGMPPHLARMAMDAMDAYILEEERPKVSVMGVAFIKDSDDTRNSPALRVIKELSGKYAVVAHDPYVETLDNVEITKDIAIALQDSCCAIFVTDHTCYRDIDAAKLKKLMKLPLVVDGRNLFDRKDMEANEIMYRGIGKGR